MVGLYLHIPFCAAICNYCNFNRGLFDASLKERYVHALLSEIGPTGNSGPRAETAPGRGGLGADTIYFGGGTPSLLEPEEIRSLIGACGEAFQLAPDVEITLEANPETVDAPRLAAYRGAGVNRLSFGVQSFRDDELKRLSRLHGADRARVAVADAREAGFSNVSLDLMMWLPGQRVNEWRESVSEAIRLRPEHLSLYLLEVYPNAPLKEEMARSRWSQAPDDDAAEMYVSAMECVESAGYEQYEISNAALPGRRSRHNLKYWTDGEWLGFGCGAHSTFRGMRWKNVSGTEDYVRKVTGGESAACDIRHMSAEERLGDALFTALRLTDGIDLGGIWSRYGVDVWERYGDALEPFVAEGLLVVDSERIRLTRRGMLLAHEVMTVFV